MSKPSILFMASRPGTPGRRRFRKLQDEAIMRADQKSEDRAHQRKFLNRRQRATLAAWEAKDAAVEESR